jgi:hypothetical protein
LILRWSMAMWILHTPWKMFPQYCQ